ncbi:MAG: CoA transferase, partial [Dehalococcoidia bacterium]
MNTTPYWDLNRVNIGRSGAVKSRPDGTTGRLHWPCKDGYVTFGGTAEWEGMSRWMNDEGVHDQRLDRDWQAVDPFTISQADIDGLAELAVRFFSARTAQELYDGAVKWRFMLYPVFTTADLLRYRQLLERRFFVQVEHEELGQRVTYPGPFLRTSEASPQLRRRAPLIGEHNRQVYQGELGLTLDELRVLKANGVI